MEERASRIDRREFLFKGVFRGGLGAVAAVLSWIFWDTWGGAGRFSSARWVLVAPLNRIPLNSVVPFPEHKIAILRVGRQVGALSLECTHLGCLVNVVNGEFLCPCHQSVFGPLGQVYSGPATRSLPWHDIMNREGRIWIHLGKKLDRPQWLAVTETSPNVQRN